MKKEPELIHIAMVEDHDIYRETICEALENSGRYRCSGKYTNLEAILKQGAQPNRPEYDQILLDLGLPGMGGIEGIGRLRELWPNARVIVLTAFTDREKVFSALQAGASGYLIKTGSSARLLNMLKEIDSGGTPIDPQIAGMILNSFKKTKTVKEEDQLSEQEINVLRLIADGETKKSVASELNLSFHTVDQYLRRIFNKLHVHSLPAAVRITIQRGDID